MEEIKIALLGCGTVGSAVAEILHHNTAEISRRAGKKIKIAKVLVNSLSKQRPDVLPDDVFTTEIDDILTDTSIPVVVELIGGLSPSGDYIKSALAQGKHVVTANKALLAEAGQPLIDVAKRHAKMLMFEAAIAGGIPIVKVIKESLVADPIKKLSGIVNGTSNFILTAMHQDELSFEKALNLAQKKGYAEADPSFDLEGIDAAHKITLLSTIAFGIPLAYDKVNVTGIQDITQLDVQYAEEMGYVIKPLAQTEMINHQYSLSIYPALLNKTHPLANVDDVMNAIFVEAMNIGETMYYGPGAGGGPTASSVIADIVEVIRTMMIDPAYRVPHLAYHDINANAEIAESDMITNNNYIRLMAEDKVGVLASATQILANNNISIEAILQKEPKAKGDAIPIVILTKEASELNMSRVLNDLKLLSSVDKNITRIRLFN